MRASHRRLPGHSRTKTGEGADFPEDNRPNLRLLTSADRKSTRLNSIHSQISYAVFCLNKKAAIDSQARDRPSALSRRHRLLEVQCDLAQLSTPEARPGRARCCRLPKSRTKGQVDPVTT